MKWVNLADREPDWEGDLEKLILRHIEDKDVQPIEFIKEYFVDNKNKEGNQYWEWLDESETHSQEFGLKLFTEDKVDKLLAEQHRNTRHDAIDVVNSHFNEMQDQIPFPEVILDSITKGIMNLKQRKP